MLNERLCGTPHTIRVRIVGVCKISGLPAREIWDNYFGGEGVHCLGNHKGECDWSRVPRKEFIEALKREENLKKRR